MRKALLLSALSVAALFGMDPEARNVKSVYILKMTSNLDQYLASELTKNGIYTVTTDPLKADAIFTDSLGEGFERKYTELYVPKTEEKKDEKKEPAAGLTASPVVRVGNSSWGRGRGTIFLVERKSRNLLWSMNRQPKNSAPRETVTQARKIVDQLKKELAVKQ